MIYHWVITKIVTGIQYSKSMFLFRAQQAMLASDLAKNSESFSPGGDLQNQVTDSEIIAAIDDVQPESHGSTEVCCG